MYAAETAIARVLILGQMAGYNGRDHSMKEVQAVT